jgi:hypothetical protein
MDLTAVRKEIKKLNKPYEIRYYKDKRKEGHRIVFKGMSKNEAIIVQHNLLLFHGLRWDLYENKRGSERFSKKYRFGIQKTEEK